MNGQFESAVRDIESISLGMTGDLTPANVADITLGKFSKVAGDAEVLRTKAMELSSTETALYDALNDSANPSDRRTKAWRDHETARKASNIAWMDFNNALRNIGLSLLAIQRELRIHDFS